MVSLPLQKKKTIWFVEDNEELRNSTVEILCFEGFEATGCPSAEEFYEMLEQGQPDLVLCDIMLPGDDGHKVLEKFRSNPSCRKIPFIFVTALTNRKEMRRSMDEGADDYLTKPFGVEELLSAIQARMDRSSDLTGSDAEIWEGFGKDRFGSYLKKVKSCLLSIEDSRASICILPMDSSVFKNVSHCLEKIVNEAHELANLSTNLLLYTQVISPEGQKSLEKLRYMAQTVDLSGLMKSISEKTGRSIVWQGNDDECFVQGNTFLMKKVIEEVCRYFGSNSNESGNIDVYMERKAGPDPSVLLSFRNTGIASNPRDQNGELTDIGLEIASAIAHILGGSLHVQMGKNSDLEVELAIPAGCSEPA